MSALYRVRRTAVGFNMTPMIDVVFLLIIFFLVSNHLAQREQRLPVELPSAVAGQRQTSEGAVRMTISVQADGRIWQDGQWLSRSQLLERLTAHPARSDGSVELRIRCDRATHYREVEPILRQAAQAGIHRVAFSVVQPGEKIP